MTRGHAGEEKDMKNVVSGRNGGQGKRLYAARRYDTESFKNRSVMLSSPRMSYRLQWNNRLLCLHRTVV